MTPEDIKDIITLARSLKRVYIKVTPYMIMGSDDNMSTLSIVYHSIPLDDIIIDWCGPISAFDCMSGSCMKQISIRFDYMYRQIEYLKNVSTIISSNDSLMDDESFINIQNMKAKDGANMYINDGNAYSMTGTMHPLNKGEDMSMTVYQTPYNLHLVEYIIEKKKKFTIHEYIQYIPCNNY